MDALELYCIRRVRKESVRVATNGFSPSELEKVAEYDESAALYVSLDRLVAEIATQFQGEKFPRCPVCGVQWDSRTSTELHADGCAYAYAKTTMERI